jgi:acyl-CoA synthetase (AMP-forming)/AMP-acid ligase II/acyl carrier protein
MAIPKTLADLLDGLSASTATIRYLRSDGGEQVVPYAELFERARGLLGQLQRHGLRCGDPLVLFVRHNAAFVDAFWACQLGGLVPVPLSGGVHSEQLLKLQRVLSTLQQPALFTQRDLWQKYKLQIAVTSPDESRVCLLEDVIHLEHEAELHSGCVDDTALIQFSSGSTSDPKGVVLTHTNLLTNLQAIVRAAAIDARDATLSWMPLHHDMGLIGFHLVPLLQRIDQVIMDSGLFVRRPVRWLEAAEKYRATLLCAPNFGYQHYLKSTSGKEHFDLRPVRLIFNGAEPVSAAVCRHFVARMQTSGLDEKALFPVYGLAEASLAVTFPQPGSGVKSLLVDPASIAVACPVRVVEAGAKAVELVCLGVPVAGCEVQIQDEDGLAMAQWHVGHVMIRGANVTRRYYRAGVDEEPPRAEEQWLDSGDLGFIGPGGLYIAGRSKDILFVAGQNRYPQDLEWLLQEHAAIEAGKVAVTAVRSEDNDEDHILVCVQYRRAPEEFVAVADRVLSTLAERTGLQATAVVPVRSLPRTSSGKLQRYRLARSWERGEYSSVLERLRELSASATDSPSAVATEQLLLDLCRQLFPDHRIQPQQNLFELGADSLMLVRIHEEIEARFPGRVEITDLFDYPDIQSLAEYIERS